MAEGVAALVSCSSQALGLAEAKVGPGKRIGSFELGTRHGGNVVGCVVWVNRAPNDSEYTSHLDGFRK